MMEHSPQDHIDEARRKAGSSWEEARALYNIALRVFSAWSRSVRILPIESPFIPHVSGPWASVVYSDFFPFRDIL